MLVIFALWESIILIVDIWRVFNCSLNLFYFFTQSLRMHKTDTFSSWNISSIISLLLYAIQLLDFFLLQIAPFVYILWLRKYYCLQFHSCSSILCWENQVMCNFETTRKLVFHLNLKQMSEELIISHTFDAYRLRCSAFSLVFCHSLITSF